MSLYEAHHQNVQCVVMGIGNVTVTLAEARLTGAARWHVLQITFTRSKRSHGGQRASD